MLTVVVNSGGSYIEGKVIIKRLELPHLDSTAGLQPSH